MAAATIIRKWARETAAARLEDSLFRVSGGGNGTAHVFTELFADEARAQISDLAATNSSPLNGALVSIKDLFDVQGHVTRAASPALMDKAVAVGDADCVARLRAAGAILVGHTNMTELAYSGLGLNPNFGTPDNLLYPGCAPGGSSSGGGVSVALELCDIAIGSDTGGSIRIPAAFNGLVGFKPTQNTVSRDGGVALSATLDSFGPIAHSVADCTDCWCVMAGIGNSPVVGDNLAEPVLVIPANFGRDNLDQAVETGFAAAWKMLIEAGFKVVEEHFPSLEYYKKIFSWKIAAYEALNTHRIAIAAHGSKMDPRVRDRILKAEPITQDEYEATIAQRVEFIRRFGSELAGRYLLLPTVAVLPPSLNELADDTAYGYLNALVLRNTSMGNFADSCSVSLPYCVGADTIGIMVTAAAGQDEQLLTVAAQLEPFLARH